MRRVLVLTAAVLAVLLACASAAWAHVTVSAPGATRGGSDQVITVRVPAERPVATTGLTLRLPPMAGVLVEPVAGWAHTQTSATLATPIVTDDGDITEAVSTITYTATGPGIAPGEFGAFPILVGQLPDVASLTFKALQKYADGTVVSWIETAAPGSASEPQHPAPVLTLAPASSAGSSGSSARSSAGSSAAVAGAVAPATAPSTTGATVLAIVALVVAAGAVGLVVVSRARGRT